MSFTTGGLFYGESIKVAELYLDIRDWKKVKKRVLADNLLQTRTQSSAARIFREISARVSLLTEAQLKFLFTATRPEQFIFSYEKLRLFLIDHKTITSLIQLEYSGFDGATVPICTFTVENAHNPHYKGGYVRLSDFKGAAVQGPKALEIIQAANRVSK